MPLKIKLWYGTFIVEYMSILTGMFSLLPIFFTDIGQLSQEQIPTVMLFCSICNVLTRIIASNLSISTNRLLAISCFFIGAGAMALFLLTWIGFPFFGAVFGCSLMGAGVGNLTPMMMVKPLEAGFSVSTGLCAEVTIIISVTSGVAPFLTSSIMYFTSDYFLPMFLIAVAISVPFTMKRFHEGAERFFRQREQH